jgi:DNA-binding response OmpR family regulator
MSKVLLVEDSKDCYSHVNHALGNTVELHWATNIAGAMHELQKESFDLVLLDIGLPDGDGYHLCSLMQTDTRLQTVPVVFLTGATKTIDKVLAFSVGADDYVTKPFDSLELKARVDAKLRRKLLASAESNVIRVGALEVNLSAQRFHLYENGEKQEIELTPIEYKLLVRMMKKPDQVFNRDELLNLIWGENVYIYPRSVDTHVSKLRKKLGSKANYIRSVHGRGYKIEVPPEEMAPQDVEFEQPLPQ